MTPISEHIRSLERYAERGGIRLVRTTLPDCVCGRACCDLIMLRDGLSPEQELLTLVHELTHWLAHRDALPGFECTLFEYEAEAVEQLVMARIGLTSETASIDEYPTDGLLSASVGRVEFATGRICAALGVEAERRT